MVKKCRQIAARCALWCIVVVKNAFGMPAGVCRFRPSCSEYAREALSNLPLWRALPLIVWRVVRCNPFVPGGDDPVPQRRRERGRWSVGQRERYVSTPQ